MIPKALPYSGIVVHILIRFLLHQHNNNNNDDPTTTTIIATTTNPCSVTTTTTTSDNSKRAFGVPSVNAFAYPTAVTFSSSHHHPNRHKSIHLNRFLSLDSFPPPPSVTVYRHRHPHYHHRRRRLSLQNDPNDNNDDDDDEQPLFYNDFDDLTSSSQQSNNSNSNNNQENKNDKAFQKLNSILSQTRTNEIRRDSRLATNWRRGNWNVRGFSLDSTTTTTSSSVSEGDGGTQEEENPENPVTITRVVTDETSPPLAGGGGEGEFLSKVVAVGRSDGTVCLVRMGSDYITKFVSIPKLVVGGGGGGEGEEQTGGGGGEGDGDGGSGGSDEVTVRVESTMVREDILFPPPEDGTGMGMIKDDENNNDDANNQQPPPSIPFEIILQFQAHDENPDGNNSIDVMLFHDDTLYTTAGKSGCIRVWNVADAGESVNSLRRRPDWILGGEGGDGQVHGDGIVALKTLARMGAEGGMDVEEHDLLLSASLDGTFALWDTTVVGGGGDDGGGDALVYRGRVGLSSSSSSGEEEEESKDGAVGIQCADVDVLAGGEYVVYFGLSTGHVVGYIVSDLINEYTNRIQQQEENNTTRHSPPTTCCEFIAHDLVHSKTTTTTTTSNTKQQQQQGRIDGITALTCGGEGSLALSPGVQTSSSSSRPGTNVLLTGGADGTVKQFEMISRRVVTDAVGDSSSSRGGGDGARWKLEHWPRLPTQRMKRRAHLFRGHDGPITAIVCGDGSIVGGLGGGSSSSKILSAGRDGTIRVWNPSDGKRELYRIDGFTDRLSSVCLDGKFLVTDGMEEMVCVHDFDVVDDDLDDMYEF